MKVEKSIQGQLEVGKEILKRKKHNKQLQIKGNGHNQREFSRVKSIKIIKHMNLDSFAY